MFHTVSINMILFLARHETVIRVKGLIGTFAKLERKKLEPDVHIQQVTVFTLNRVLEKNVDENEPVPGRSEDDIPTYLAKLRAKRNNADSAWQRKYKEMQLNANAEKENLKRGLEIVKKQKTEAQKTIEEVTAKKAKLNEDRSKFNSVKAKLEHKAEEGHRMVKIKKEAVEKFHENMMEREEKLSKERRNFIAEQRKFKDKLKSAMRNDPDWTPPGTASSNSRPGPSRTTTSTVAPTARHSLNPPVPVSRPSTATPSNNSNVFDASVDVKPEIKLEAKPVRDPDFGPNPLRTRPILDRGAKRRYSDIIILD